MASKPQQILQLTPTSEIVFEGPFDKVVTSYLELKNPSDERVCFKVKTTAPRRYCVRPNSGIVAPGGKQRIAIMLQPIEQESQSERMKHKFMVQSTIVSDEDANLEDVWNAVENIMDSKLRCVFQASGDNTQAAATTSSSPIANPNSETSSKRISTTASTTQAELANQQTLSQKSASGSNEASQNKTNKVASPSDGLMKTEPVTSTPTRSSSKAWAANVSSSMDQQQNLIYINRSDNRSSADKSVASSHNLTTSFLQPMSDDHKVVFVSLLMLIIGVILGKYII